MYKTTAAGGKKAAEEGRFTLGVSGKLRKLSAWSCAKNEQGTSRSHRDLPRFPPRSGTGRRKGEAMTTKKPDLPIITFASRDAWEAWLEEHHTTSDGLWLKIAKQGSGLETVSYAQALEVALCYGWIDGQKASFDDHYWLQRFTPRGARSKWSKVNRQKATELIEKGEMKPAGLKEVERAKEIGRASCRERV